MKYDHSFQYLMRSYQKTDPLTAEYWCYLHQFQNGSPELHNQNHSWIKYT